MVQELLRLAGVFAGDAVSVLEHFKGADGDVAEIADGGGDEVEAGSEGFGHCLEHGSASRFPPNSGRRIVRGKSWRQYDQNRTTHADNVFVAAIAPLTDYLYRI